MLENSTWFPGLQLLISETNSHDRPSQRLNNKPQTLVMHKHALYVNCRAHKQSCMHVLASRTLASDRLFLSSFW